MPQLSFDKDNVFFLLCEEEKTKKKTAKKIHNITVLSFRFSWSGDRWTGTAESHEVAVQILGGSVNAEFYSEPHVKQTENIPATTEM